MPELLLEILSEEIPARMQARAADDLKRLVTDGLKAAGLAFSSADAYVTPRRLCLVVDGLPEESKSEPITQKGPKVGAPEQAIDGFLRKVARSSVDDEDIRIVNSPKGDFYEFYALAAPKPTESELRSIIPDAMDALPWQKSMRWSKTDVKWVRPVHGILAVFNEQLLPLDWDLVRTTEALNSPTNETRTQSSNKTVGHRFLAPDAITVTDFADYKAKLFAAKVMLDPAERRAKIEAKAKEECEKAGLSLKDDPGLLDEVTGLVEWPQIHIGTIDDQFMDLPDEVLSTSMRSHQKYFSTLGKDGKLANRFIVVANTETDDGGKQVVAGNERVLRARLSDAKFFWDQDRSQTLESRVGVLKERVFHAKLGNLLEKVERVWGLSTEIAKLFGDVDLEMVGRAARLAKADLSTGMVGEFPELQGIMGRYYARHDGEDASVADAIAEHYSPLGPNDICPTQPVSVCVALADKIDTLVGFFAIDEKPTGSKDPYALRRAALGIIRIILERKLTLSLNKVLEEAYYRLLHTYHSRGSLFEYAENRADPLVKAYPRKSEFSKQYFVLFSDARNTFDDSAIYEGGRQSPYKIPTFDDLKVQLLDFFADRLKVHLREQGVRHDLIEAVFALGGEDDLVRLIKRVEALQEFLTTVDGDNLLTAYKRAANILRAEEKKDGKTYDEAPDVSILAREQVEAVALADALDSIKSDLSIAIAEGSFWDAMALLAQLRQPVDAFFDDVTVNADDAALRVNRLKLLNGIRSALDGVADFSKIEGK